MIVNGNEKWVNEKVVVITGGTGGFGSVLVDTFSMIGYRVAYTSRHKRGKETPLLLWHKVDTTCCEDVLIFFETILHRWNRIDIVVINAGVSMDAFLAITRQEDIDTMVEVNLKGFFCTVKAILPHMIERKEGHIIAVSSYVASAGRAGQSIYAATKAGLTGAVKSVAREVGQYNIRVNAVMPGYMDVGMGQRAPEKVKAYAVSENVLGRLASAEESAAFIAYVSSMQNVSGQVFNLDSRIVGWA